MTKKVSQLDLHIVPMEFNATVKNPLQITVGLMKFCLAFLVPSSPKKNLACLDFFACVKKEDVVVRNVLNTVNLILPIRALAKLVRYKDRFSDKTYLK